MNVKIAVSVAAPVLIGLFTLGCGSSSGGGGSSSTAAPVSSGSTATTTSGTTTGGTTGGTTTGGTTGGGTVSVPTTAEDRFYEPHVRNVLYNYCISCHADTADAAYAAYPLNGFPSGVGVYNETLNRVDLNDPEGSLLLAKMSNTSAVPHGGGEILKPGDVGYAWVLNWVRQGAVYDQASLGPRTFANHVQPILSAQCFGCHSGGTGGFTVASNANITAGYNEMLSVTTANDGPGSLIIRTNDGTDGHAGGAGWTVGTAERAVILQWITDGRLFQ
jgi:hypothetical protein